MKLLDSPGVVEELVARLSCLRPDTARRWGSMSAHEMVCHLTDSYRLGTGERAVGRIDTWNSRTIVRFVALHTGLTWPKGVPTRPEVDPKRQGTRPGDFDRERHELATLIASFALRRANYPAHPIFGPLTPREWMIWGYKHSDHHFRQFGL